jgi:hypothetical protein
MNKTYLGVEGNGVELLHPFVSRKNDLLCLRIALSLHAHMTSMIYEGRQVARIYRIYDIKEELSFRSFLCEEFVWEESLYLFLLLDHFNDLLDAELLVYRDLDKVDRREFKESLLSNEDLLHKIFVVTTS